MMYQCVEPLTSDTPLAVWVKASGSSPDRLSKRCVASEMLRLDERLESGDTFVAKIIVLQIRSGKFCTNLGAFEHDLHSAQHWPEEDDEGGTNGSSG